MATLNRVELIGNVGMEPGSRYLNEKKMCFFTLATSERYTDAQGNHLERTEWHRIVCYGRVCEVVEHYVHQGTQLFIAGHIRTRQYKTRDTGAERSTTEIIVDDLQLLGKAPQ